MCPIQIGRTKDRHTKGNPGKIIMTVRGLKDIEQGEAALATRFTQFKLKVEGRRKITAIYSYFILLGVKVMEPGPSQS